MIVGVVDCKMAPEQHQAFGPVLKQAVASVLPQELAHVEIRHEPDSTPCARGCARQRVGEDVRQKLDYTPGVFTV